ncbi:phycobilisome protein [Nodosilinea sp. LEGE 07088]|uniref:phycobilisome protein n=1 Tax=Nodosilinea sp. LEGE 07088 TaxID=2777968 RepID=UPI0018807193|nr:phycobilisome protein [Nodosilinea sp. LEGE 07088]MBE9136081.1 phycobilisome protein [Nodosilinea sp. LEGE 07088]
MLTNVQSLIHNSDGRYASDQELMFFQTYLSSVGTRLRAYQKIQRAEQQIIAQVMAQLKAQRPSTFQVGGQDLTAKWQRDTVRVLRYSATALLLDDTERFKETLLTWFQSIMRAFKTQESCHLTYTAMQAVMPNHLNAEELKLYIPILELCRVVLGAAT